MLPPLTSRPPQFCGYPMNSAIQRIVCPSISLAAGESFQAPALGLTTAAIRSPNAPMGVALEVMYPKNRGMPVE